MKKSYFTRSEIILLFLSQISIILAFLIFQGVNYLYLLLSLLGALSLIFCSKGNPLGQILIFIFAVGYGIVSFIFGYYGEMITYMFMSAPMAILSFIEWIKHPSREGGREVEINTLSRLDFLLLPLVSVLATVIFYFILAAFNTQNLILSTVSIFTSAAAVYLTFRRSPYYALAYAANDIVLIALWVLAAGEDISYVALVSCFAVFLFNDLYGFFNWQRLKAKQKKIAQ